MKQKSKFGFADIAMVTTCFLWGLNAVVAKNALGDTPETFRIFVFNGLRIPVSSLLLFLTVKLSGGSIWIKKEHLPFIAAVSFFGMFLFMVGYIAGLNMTSASNAGIIIATTPLCILLVSFITKIERPTKSSVAGILVGFCGMLVLIFKNGSVSFHPGDLLIAISCVCWAVYTVLGKKIVSLYA
ncbi:unnamed protein product, partial [marine sediment metagenome]